MFFMLLCLPTTTFDYVGFHGCLWSFDSGFPEVSSVIPEFPSFLIPLPFMIATLLAVSAHRRIRISSKMK